MCKMLERIQSTYRYVAGRKLKDYYCDGRCVRNSLSFSRMVCVKILPTYTNWKQIIRRLFVDSGKTVSEKIPKYTQKEMNVLKKFLISVVEKYTVWLIRKH